MKMTIGEEFGYNPTAKSFSEKIRSITVASSYSFVSLGTEAEGHSWMAYTEKLLN